MTVVYTGEDIKCCDKRMLLDAELSDRCGHCHQYFKRVFVCSVCENKEIIFNVNTGVHNR